ncbi:hypothetical protein [Rubellimicrobium roseum]|uniref:DUF2269 family protein n=1 Tax=Rubellimicrobium roseum TaxID=687525 RepID=A0A5C4NCI5_9RHOB|nr:hypothetical protein [Rubellimicrobium roseum]TNC68513.1 hypothetical protein FHG71_14605 [Rubellimicrobium roseum]
MEPILFLALAHVLGVLLWSGAALRLGLRLAAARRDEAAVLRAVREGARLDRRALRPSLLAVLISGGVLAATEGVAVEAWALLAAALGSLALALGRAGFQPACARALRRDGEAALMAGRRALRHARRGLALQVPTILLLLLRPGWGGIAILGGLLACLALAAALLTSLDDGAARAA